MKKLVIILFAAICLFACKKSDYSIDGTTDVRMNGTVIYLKERVNHEWVTLDSTTVKDGKFVFKGATDSAKIAYILFEYPAGNRAGQAFVLEAGKVTASVDPTGAMSVKGTAQNDLLQAYQDEKLVFYKKAEAYYNSHNDSTMTLEQKDALKNKMQEMSKEEVAIDVKYSSSHVNTLVGTHIFTNSSYNMNLAEKEAVVALMNENTKKTERIQEIIENIAAEKRVAVGSPYVDFALPALAGGTLKLSDLVGKTDYVLIDFWASWCGPCMASLPDLKDLYAKNKGTKLEVLGVSLDENRDAWNGVVTQKQLGWKHVSDLKGWKCEGSRLYAVSSIPCTVLIDKSGKIVGRNLNISEINKLMNSKTEKK